MTTTTRNNEKVSSYHNHQSSIIQPPTGQMPAADQVLAEESELVEALSSISRLQASLYQFATLMDSDVLEVIIETQAALKMASDSLNNILEDAYHRRVLIENWENEGGKVEFLSP